GRERAGGALQRVDHDARRRVVGPRGLVSPRDLEGVAAVDHVDLVPVPRQGPRQAIDERGVAAEAVRAEERREHAELHADLLTAGGRSSSKTLSSSLADRAQEKCDTLRSERLESRSCSSRSDSTRRIVAAISATFEGS